MLTGDDTEAAQRQASVNAWAAVDSAGVAPEVNSHWSWGHIEEGSNDAKQAVLWEIICYRVSNLWNDPHQWPCHGSVEDDANDDDGVDDEPGASADMAKPLFMRITREINLFPLPPSFGKQKCDDYQDLGPRL